MRLGTLFSGIGAPEQAAARVWPKHDVVFACELDKYARQSYLANYAIDEEHFHKDVKELDGTQYQGKVDVLIGGSPCQAFSIAGMRGGTDDERGQLIYQYVRVVDEVKAPVIVYENVKGFLSIKTLQYPHILNEELLWQEVNLNISSSSKITLGKYLLQRCAEYLVLKNIKSDISHIKKLALTSEKWENVVLIGAMKKLQSYLTQIKQIMKKQNLFQTEQTLLLECKEEDLDLILNLLSTMNHLSIKDINLSEEKKDTLEVKEGIRESIDLLLSNISEDLLKKAKLSITLMEENWTIELKTYAYAMGKLNTLISIINLWRSSQSLWTEILSISISQISNIKSNSVFDEFVEALRAIGYYCHYEVLNTKDYGVPQNRERIFLVGFLDHEAYYRFAFAPKIPLEKRLKDVLEPSVDEKYYLSETAIKGFQAHAERMAERGNGFKFEPTDGNTVASSVTTRAGGRPDDNFVKVVGKLDCKDDDHIRRVYDCFGISPCLTTMQGGNQEPKIIELTEPMIYDDYNCNLKTDGIACALTTNCGSSARRNGQKVVELKTVQRPRGKNKGGKHEACPTISSHSFEHNNLVFEPKIVAMRGRYSEGGKIIQKLEYNGIDMSNALTTVQKCNLADDAYRIRKLTPLECWRLQDFPDKAHEKAKKAGVSDTQLYKQAGNSMTVAVVESIFRQIDKALKGEYCAGQGSLF